MPDRPRRFRLGPPPRQCPTPSERERARQPHRRLLWTKRFRRFRLWLLSARPLCEEPGCTEAGCDVHHVRGLARHPEDLCDPEHVEVLCHSHHSTRTARGE